MWEEPLCSSWLAVVFALQHSHGYHFCPASRLWWNCEFCGNCESEVSDAWVTLMRCVILHLAGRSETIKCDKYGTNVRNQEREVHLIYREACWPSSAFNSISLSGHGFYRMHFLVIHGQHLYSTLVKYYFSLFAFITFCSFSWNVLFPYLLC